MAWDVRSIRAWMVVCQGCGDWAPSWGWSDLEAVQCAEEAGWVDGLCPKCVRERERDLAGVEVRLT